MRDFLREHVDLAARTVAGYRSITRTVICNPDVGIGDTAIDTLTGASITAWRRGLVHQGVTPANARLAFSVLRSALSWDVEVGRLDRNPALGLRVRRTKTLIAASRKDPVRLPTWDEVHRVCLHIPGWSERLMFLLFAFSGPRASELFALRPEGVLRRRQEVEFREVWVKATGKPWRTEPLKSGVERRTPVPSGLFDHLMHFQSNWTAPVGDRVDTLFRPWNAVRRGPGIWTNELWRSLVMAPANERAGTSIRTKDLRAYAASMLVDIGATQAEAQVLLGHASHETTQRHYIRAQLASAHDADRSRLRFDPTLGLRARQDALWVAFVDRHGDPLSQLRLLPTGLGIPAK